MTAPAIQGDGLRSCALCGARLVYEVVRPFGRVQSYCTGCGACELIARKRAVDATERVLTKMEAPRRQGLFMRTPRTCTYCGQAFVAVRGKLCSERCVRRTREERQGPRVRRSHHRKAYVVSAAHA